MKHIIIVILALSSVFSFAQEENKLPKYVLKSSKTRRIKIKTTRKIRITKTIIRKKIKIKKTTKIRIKTKIKKAKTRTIKRKMAKMIRKTAKMKKSK